jgi:hypothetical protein
MKTLIVRILGIAVAVLLILAWLKLKPGSHYKRSSSSQTAEQPENTRKIPLH